MLSKRAAGVLLHPTSLPGPFGIGDIGPEAHRYIDWLADAGVAWWQVLPLQAVGDGFSPYCTRSTFAGNTALISPEDLVADGLLERAEVDRLPRAPEGKIDFRTATALKEEVVRLAFERFRRGHMTRLAEDFGAFRASEKSWLADYAVFAALKDAHAGAAWFQWEEPLALRADAALSRWIKAHEGEIEKQEFAQFLFGRQWKRVRDHARARGLRILGDLPMFVALDSAEVWAHQELFLLDDKGRPTQVAGVPPDYFNADGQLWGNPLYDWAAMERDGFAWWIERVRQTLDTVDAIRLDHFRGFASYWAVDARETTARNGRWCPGPGRKVFDAIRAALGDLPFVAEDLGDIDEPVNRLRDELDLPGMAVLQFAFSPHSRSTFMPYRHRRRLVVYTGTHDNNTTTGWYEQDAREEEKDFARRYLGVSGEDFAWNLVRCALGSVADLAIIPHQDLCALGSWARMNTPGTSDGNWRFRIDTTMLDTRVRDRLAEALWLYGRKPEQQG